MNPELQSIVDEYKQNGIVVVRGVLNVETIKYCIQDTFKSVLNMPWTDDCKNIWKEISEIVCKDAEVVLPKHIVKMAKDNYPEMGGFAALTRSPSFHTEGLWKVRSDPRIVDIHRAIYGLPLITGGSNSFTQYNDICTTFDRISFKFPQQGETEFCHWDNNPFYWSPNEELTQGMVALTSTTFRGAPGTHTVEFRDKFINKYPKSERKDQYFIDAKEDPLNLQSQVKDYELNPGDMVIWSNKLLHEARKNKRTNCRIAYFISYYPRGKESEVVKEAMKKANTTIDQDRKRSFETGTHPLVFPSGTAVSLYSQRTYSTHPEILEKYVSRFTKGFTIRTYGDKSKNAGKQIRCPVDIPLDNYSVPELTPLGLSLL